MTNWFTLLVVPTVQAIVTKDGTGRLPTLGWNSWNAYHCDITEDKFLTAAKALVSTGLQASGYNYVNIDDCWQNKDSRDQNGHLVPNATRFPDNGIAGLAEKVHAMNLKLGIYSTASPYTCAGYPASLGYEDVDAKDFSDWGIDYEYVACAPDYVKTTSNGTCNTELEPNLAPPGYDWSTSNSATRFDRMRDALAKQNRVIDYSLCIWGTADVFSWGNNTGISWRMSDDIQPTWGDITRILNEESFRLYSTDFWGHNDMDMLEVGNGITPAEERSHFAFWAANKSPLLIGTDLTKLSSAQLDLLKNKYLLAFNQDAQYGGPVRPYKWGTNPDYTFNNSYPAEYWAGPSTAGTLVLMLNNGNDTVSKYANYTEIPGLGGTAYQLTDVWTGEDLGCVQNYTTSVASHDTAAILVGSAC